jgi:hypothetical protein
MGFKMYAYAHTPTDTKSITVTSIADFRNEISEQTPSGNGMITKLASSLKNSNGGSDGEKRAPFNFTWKADKHVPATLFTTLKPGATFTLELRIGETDDKGVIVNGFNFNFYQCKFIKSRIRSGGKVKVEATYGLFRKLPD